MPTKLIKVTVIYPVVVEIEFDDAREEDFDYLEDKRDEAKNKADDIIESSGVDSVIHDCEIDEMIE
jgi:hypothetical protein